jgi:hypothetical protein
MAKGSGFNQFEDEFLKKIPRGRKMYEYEAKMTLTREKGTGGNVWWVMHYDPDLVNAHPMTEEIFETVRVMAGMVKSENERVESAYQKALRDRNLDDDAIDAIAGVVEDLDSDLVDDE